MKLREAMEAQGFKPTAESMKNLAVDRVVDRKKEQKQGRGRRRLLYRVKWEDPSIEDSWIPFENFVTKDCLREYWNTVDKTVTRPKQIQQLYREDTILEEGGDC